jgi:Relaxase/Mobilisation nuclease domain
VIVGFSKHGTGAVYGAVNYLTSRQNPDGNERNPPPEMLRGHPAVVRGMIDSLEFKHRYTSGVLSFAPGEAITSEMEQAIMDGFEKAAFAGLERDQYSILWVRHIHAGHHELNFLVPRVELSTGHSLNIRPPANQAQELFDTFRSMVNARYGLADPDDPARALDVSLPNLIAKLRANETREGITEYVRREMDAGRITDREGVERYLQSAGYQFNRKGSNSRSVLKCLNLNELHFELS